MLGQFILEPYHSIFPLFTIRLLLKRIKCMLAFLLLLFANVLVFQGY